MERVFIQTIGRWPKGTRKEWPKQTWDQIAHSNNMSIEQFSMDVDEYLHKSMNDAPKKRGRPPKESRE